MSESQINSQELVYKQVMSIPVLFNVFCMNEIVVSVLCSRPPSAGLPSFK